MPPLDCVLPDIVTLIRSARRLVVEPDHSTDLGHKFLLTRYTAASTADPLPLVLSAVEALARRLAAASAWPGSCANVSE